MLDRRTENRTLPTPSASSSGPAPTGSPPPAAASASDAFDGWAVSDGGGSTRFLETEDHHGGDAALLITRPSGDQATVEPVMTQNIAVAQDSRIVVSFWAAADGGSAPGAVQVRLGTVGAASIAVPGGPFGWTRFSAAWTVPPGVTTTQLVIGAAGETEGTRIDDVSVQGQGSKGVIVANGGFESSSGAIAITDSSLVLPQSGTLHLASRLAPSGAYSWTAQEYTGGPVLRGRGRFAGGTARLPLSPLPTGYYSLTLRVKLPDRSVNRTTDVVITPPAPAADTTANPMLGVGVHLTATDPQLAQKVGDLAALGIRAARTDADWATIESRPGQYDFSAFDPIVRSLESRGIRPLLIPDYRNPLYDDGRTPSSPGGIAAYARFAGAVAARFPGADIDVYNEFDWRFNDGACGKSPACYLALLRPSAASVKAAGTSAAVAGPDISGLGVQQTWMQGFLDGGGLDLVDALDMHPYVQPDRPEVLDEQLDALRAAMAAKGGGDKPIWFTEFGSSTVSGWVSENEQAEDVARVFAVAAAHGVTRIYWYDAIDDGTDRADQEDNFGLFRGSTSFAPSAFVPKPAAAVVATMIRSAGTVGAQVQKGLGGDSRFQRLASGGALAWSVGDPVPVVPGPGIRATSMTGRPLKSLASLGSSPVLLSGTGHISGKR